MYQNVDLSDQNKPATKLVEVYLSGLTRVQYSEVVEVPADITDDELNRLVDMRYQAVDGGEFVSDARYWERGECFAVNADRPNAVASVRATRATHGLDLDYIVVQALADDDRSVSSAGNADGSHGERLRGESAGA
jgi:hypothetical protein